MAMNKSELKKAFHEVVASEFAEIPSDEETIDYTFSNEFLRKMDFLLFSQKKTSWNLKYFAKRHVAMIAIVLLGVFITACGVVRVIRTDSKLQEDAIAAHNLLLDAYGFDENGYVCYPDTYAGSWVEEDKLVIALTDTSEESVAKYKAWAGEYAGVLQFEQAEYSYNYLYSKMEEVVNDVTERHDIEIIDYCVSQKENEIVITVDLSNYLAALWITYDVPVSFTVYWQD